MANFFNVEGFTDLAKIWKERFTAGALWIELFTVPTTPTPANVFADYTLGGFDGYAAIGNPSETYGWDSGSSRGYVDFGSHSFTCTGTSTQVLAVGFILYQDDPGGSGYKVIYTAHFAVWVPFGNTGSESLTIHPKIWIAQG